MRKALRKLVGYWRPTVVLVAALALMLNGANSAQRLFHQWEEPSSNQQMSVDLMMLVEGPPAPDQFPQNMAHGGKPWKEQSAVLTSPIMVKPDNTENRNRVVADEHQIWTSAVSDSDQSAEAKTSSALVSPRLGIQFTLVGAKPSGTS